jgi:molecular chaperone HscB
MQVLDLSQNYFDLFEQRLNFAIDLTRLHQKQQNLQAIFHPDRFVNATDRDKRLSVQQASWVNEAYQTLTDPVKRARYMLMISGLEMNDESETTSDIEFLMEQIALREQMEAARDKDDPLEECDIIIRDVKLRLAEVSTEFSQKFEAGELDTAKLVSRKMQFLQRIFEQVMDLQFQLEEELS